MNPAWLIYATVTPLGIPGNAWRAVMMLGLTAYAIVFALMFALARLMINNSNEWSERQ